MSKPRQFVCHFVFSIYYRQVQNSVIWCIVILRCLVLPVFSSGLKTVVSARHLIFFLDLLLNMDISWNSAPRFSFHYPQERINTRDLSVGGFYLPDMHCLKAFIWQSLRNSQLDCYTPTSTHLQCLISSAATIMCPSSWWECWIKPAEIQYSPSLDILSCNRRSTAAWEYRRTKADMWYLPLLRAESIQPSGRSFLSLIIPKPLHNRGGTRHPAYGQDYSTSRGWGKLQ